MKKSQSSQTGFTLVELMVAMLLGLFLVGGIMQIFIGSRQTYRMQENLSRLQENGRFAMDFITRDNRMIGYQGCGSRSVIPNVIALPSLAPVTLVGGLSTPLIGSDNVANNWSSSACGGTNCVAGTDALTYHFGAGCANLIGNLTPVNANIQIPAPNSCNISAGDVVMVSDCSSTDIFIATNASSGSEKQSIAHSSSNNTGNNLSKAYGSDAEVLAYRSYSFFIRNNAAGEPALWRLDNAIPVSTTNPVELVEGVENMQILYGADTDATPDGTPNYYVPAGLNMNQVVSIRISILVRSMDNGLAAQPVAYTYNGATVTPTDRRIRRVFTSTIALRNRLP
ncbi:PilW family protein [Candidatus Methylobacter oryzae]|uniref:Prepilin-type N-terminal cleavage/methylation domain-containing protein n=1 Tax=Candidatus Methylobacter oryzae TaxID=2497749 RepID=A0ABY3C9M6_9GAMM|nr:PilW family protein [Candidatus Methylobacter oryzae]TRW92787.1 prepilin-type N-terminal cleavage/methylation domain-containing protein [Candidatus Methylobacter oryzae]